MRIRNTFVSNSSTASYTCAACGGTEGYDDNACSWSDVGLCECENGHTLHDSCANLEFLNDKDVLLQELSVILPDHINYLKEQIEKYGDVKDFFGLRKSDRITRVQKQLDELSTSEIGNLASIYEEYSDWRNSLDSKYCPVCQFNNMNEEYLFKYLIQKFNTSKEELLDNIRDEFKSYDEFKAFIKREPDAYSESHH